MAAEAVTAECWIFAWLVLVWIESAVVPLLPWTAVVEGVTVVVPELFASVVEIVAELGLTKFRLSWLTAMVVLGDAVDE